ncbi:hypothetical protein NLI96_g12431 [Meripilus lineatus]|uniref:Uncharacterized protein n=1 Tax=Meripilus lineatus TaxID=2056292 RepID=A0AAD5UQ11_9APHY|nr:hypothetical protein NLI96_g12431 [Physisporinus lineatus]
MELGPIFRRLRTTAFCCIIGVSFVWTILFCVDLFIRWDNSDIAQRNLVVVLVIVNAITVVILPILLIVRFRAWLDAIRLIFLIFAHGATALAYTLWFPFVQCPNATSADQVAVCRVFSMFILIASWINPGLLLAYAICLAVAVNLYYRRGVSSPNSEMQDEEKNNDDANTLDTARRPSVLPIMTPPPMGAAPLMDRSSFSNSRVGSSEITTHVSHASRHLSIDIDDGLAAKTILCIYNERFASFIRTFV